MVKMGPGCHYLWWSVSSHINLQSRKYPKAFHTGQCDGENSSVKVPFPGDLNFYQLESHYVQKCSLPKISILENSICVYKR